MSRYGATVAEVLPIGSNGDDAPTWRTGIIDGATWLRTGSDTVQALWGAADAVPMALNQPTIVAGDTGSGKTTLAQHVTLGAIGCPGYDTVLGWPVHQVTGGRTALYLASDRPEQARLSLRRMVTTPDAWDSVEQRLRVWQGPPPSTLSKFPGMLVEMAGEANAGLVIVDSLKDMALRLSEDEVGGAINLAHQLLVSAGVDVISLHHPRKRGRDHADSKPTMDDLYGSAWLAAGAGSVIFLTKSPTSTEGVQTKSPNGTDVTFRYRIDTTTGQLATGAEDDILVAIRDAPDGISTKDVARWALQIGDPTEAQVEQVRRRIKALEATGMVTTTGVGRSTKWVES